MAYFIVTSKVNDYDTWKKVYDGHEEIRQKFGIYKL